MSAAAFGDDEIPAPDRGVMTRGSNRGVACFTAGRASGGVDSLAGLVVMLKCLGVDKRRDALCTIPPVADGLDSRASSGPVVAAWRVAATVDTEIIWRGVGIRVMGGRGSPGCRGVMGRVPSADTTPGLNTDGSGSLGVTGLGEPGNTSTTTLDGTATDSDCGDCGDVTEVSGCCGGAVDACGDG